MAAVETLLQLCQQFDLVVNCSGLGAGELVDDHDVLPVKGQVIKVCTVCLSHTMFSELSAV